MYTEDIPRKCLISFCGCMVEEKVVRIGIISTKHESHLTVAWLINTVGTDYHPTVQVASSITQMRIGGVGNFINTSFTPN